jgi:Undecaprenyl-phosphate glucose phosphotransferase
LSDVSTAGDKRLAHPAPHCGEPAALAPRPFTLAPDRQRRRINRDAIVSAVRLADFLAVLVAGMASMAMRSVFVWPLVLLVLALAARMPKPGIQAAADPTRRLSIQLCEGLVHVLPAFGFGLLAAMAVLQPEPAERALLITWLLLWALTAAGGIVAVRLALWAFLARWRRAGRLRQAVAIFGTGELAERLVERLRAACPESIEIVGVFDDRVSRRIAGPSLADIARGTTADLIALSRQQVIDRVIVALPHSAEQRLLEILRKLHQMPVEISLAPDMVGFNVPAKDQGEFGGLPLLDVYGKPLTFGQGLVKGAFDRVAAAAGMIVLSPALLAVAVAIKLDSKGPVLFRQNRYGFGDRVIQVYKFRTMKAELADSNGEKQTEINDPRITRVGAVLRRWSLDELPQLLNVLRGELSLVGPRPHAISMRVRQRRNEDIVPDYALRHHVKPGITGWAQVNGYHGPVETEKALHERVAYDLDYINHWSLWFDIRILLRTTIIAFGQRHAY